MTIFQPDARKYSADETRERFVSNRVWNTIRNPTKNRVLCGVPGAGKTIVLKRSSWPAMVRDSSFMEGAQFSAFYCNLRDLERLQTALRSPSLERDDPTGEIRGKIFKFFSAVHLLVEITDDLIEAAAQGNGPEQKVLVEAFLEVCDRNLGKGIGLSLDEIWDELLEIKNDGFSALYDFSTLDELLEACDPGLAPDQIIHQFYLQLEKRRFPMKLGLLFDQFEVVPAEFQYVFSDLLRRESSDLSYCVIAATPYSFSPNLPSRGLQPGVDFELALCEYFPSEEREYQEFLEYVWEKLRPDSAPLSSSLQGGIGYLATMSSRSVRRFLELCHACGAHQATQSDLISRSRQKEVVRRGTADFQETLKGTSEVPRGALWSLVQQLYDKGRTRSQSSESIPGNVTWRAPALSGVPELGPEEELIVKKGFQEGAFLFLKASDARFNTLPQSWALAPLLGELASAPFDYSKTVSLEKEQLKRLVHFPRGRKEKLELAGLAEIKQVFLSLSFRNIAQQRVAEDKFREAFGAAQIRIVTGGSAEAALIDDIALKIHESDFTLLDSTHLSPNIVLEMGLTYGVGHRVFPLVAEDENTALSPDYFPFLLNMGITRYSLAKEGLDRARDALVRKARLSVGPPQLLMESSTRRVKLRVNQKGKVLAVYYPPSRESVWQGMLGRIQDIARSRGYKCLVVNWLPNPAGLPLFDNLLWAICKGERILIDTSGQEGVDLFGAFGLGFAVGLGRVGWSKDVRRVEEAGKENPVGLSMWPENRRKVWRAPEDVWEYVEEFLPRKKQGRRGR